MSRKSKEKLLSLSAGFSVITVLAASAEEPNPVPDLSGMWGRNSFAYESPESGLGPVENVQRLPSGGRDRTTLVGDASNPILTPRAAAIVKKFGDISKAGLGFPDPNNQCWPEGPPYVYRVLETQILQQPGEIVILYSFDHQARHIYLNRSHPSHVVPSWYGDSIGHFEGGTLIVDTVGVKVGPFSMIDRYGTPYTENMHLVERFRLVDLGTANAVMALNERENGRIGPDGGGGRADPNDMGKALQISFTVEDSQVFTAPWSATVTYRRDLEPLTERVCPENLHNYGVAVDPMVPMSAKPDF
jgi:hypothetical protein